MADSFWNQILALFDNLSAVEFSALCDMVSSICRRAQILKIIWLMTSSTFVVQSSFFFQFSRHRFALFVAESFSCFCVEVKNVTLSSFFRSPYALNWYFFTKICSLFSNDYIKLKLFSRTIELFIGFLILSKLILRNVT